MRRIEPDQGSPASCPFPAAPKKLEASGLYASYGRPQVPGGPQEVTRQPASGLHATACHLQVGGCCLHATSCGPRAPGGR